MSDDRSRVTMNYSPTWSEMDRIAAAVRGCRRVLGEPLRDPHRRISDRTLD